MGNASSSTAGGNRDVSLLSGTFPVTQTEQVSVNHQNVTQGVDGKRIPSDELYRPYSVGNAPHPDTKIFWIEANHTPRGRSIQNFNSSLRSPDAPRLPWGPISLQNDYVIQRELGESSEGTVYLAKRKLNGEPMAIKVLKDTAISRNIADLPTECLFHLSSIRFHRHILSMTQIDITDEAEIWQCLDFCNAGDLLHFCERADSHRLHPIAQMKFAIHVFIQLGEAISFLHYGLSRNVGIVRVYDVDPNYRGPILHNDLKPENVMLNFGGVNDMGMPDIRLGDFGHSTLASRPHRCAGSRSYFSPEAIAGDVGRDGSRIQMASDVYTFGLTMYYLITRRRWTPGVAATNLRLPDGYDQLGMTEVLRHCLRLDPHRRPTMNFHPQTGLMNCVEFAWAERSKIHDSHPGLESNFWTTWHGEAVKAGRGN